MDSPTIAMSVIHPNQEMTNFNYKEYSLEKLEDWMHDVLSSDDVSPHEVYSTIRKVVQDQYNYHKEQSQKCFGLLELLSGHRPVSFEQYTEEELNAMCDKAEADEKERCREYNLREAEYYDKRAQLDAVSEEIKKAGGYEWTPDTRKELTYQEAIDAGWTMTGDGFWVKE